MKSRTTPTILIFSILLFIKCAFSSSICFCSWMGKRKGGLSPQFPMILGRYTYRILASSLDWGLHGKWKCWMIFLKKIKIKSEKRKKKVDETGFLPHRMCVKCVLMNTQIQASPFHYRVCSSLSSVWKNLFSAADGCQPAGIHTVQ